MDPARYPDYFGHRKLLQYLEEYADHFDLRRHVRLHTKVVSCTPEADGKWKVKTQQNEDDSVESIYDAVFACSGALSKPFIPEVEGLKTFKGQVFHSRIYRRPSGLEGKRIAIIGFGNSAADLSSELSWQAKELHLVTRRGGWVVPRFVLGKPAEAFDSMILIAPYTKITWHWLTRYIGRVAETILPAKLSQWLQMQLCNHVMGKLPGVIRPEHGLMEANVTMRSDLVDNIKTGRIIPHRAGIEKITEPSLILTNGTSIDVDVIIFCTGYHLTAPYVPEDSYRLRYNEILNTSNTMDLYKMVASPLYPNLFFIGFVELAGPLIPVSEAQSRWATAVIANRIKLPSARGMYESIAAYQAHLASTVSRPFQQLWAQIHQGSFGSSQI